MIRDLIARGIGFTPASVRFIPTHGLGVGIAVVDGGVGWYTGRRRRMARQKCSRRCGWLLWLVGA